jgi:tight adherence protein C
MSDLDLLPVLLAAAASAVCGLAALSALLAGAPPDDRPWRERPPLGWWLAWPLVRPIGAVLDPLLPPRGRAGLARALRQSGLDLALEPGQIAAGCVVAGVAFGLGASISLAGADAMPGWMSMLPPLAAVCAALWPLSWLRERRAARLHAIVRALPFFLDVVTLSVESGANLTGALRHAASKGPGGPLQAELERVLRDVRAGRSRAEALRAMAERLDVPAISSWVAALVTAERHGSGLGPILRAQAEQRRTERFQVAEKRAMKAPVKMLFPLLVFIFPCTFVLLCFPVVVRLLEEGLLR